MKKALTARLRAHHRAIVNWSAAVSGALVGLRTALLGVDEVVPFGAEVGELLYDAGLAYLTAWLFQFFVVVLPERVRADRLARTLAPRVDSLIELGYSLAEGVSRAAGTDPSQFPPEAATVRAATANAKPEEDFPGWGESWVGVLVHVTRRASDARALLKPFYPVMNVDLLEALENEETQARKLMFVLRAGRTLRRSHLRDLADPVIDWLAALDRLLELRRDSLAVDLRTPVLQPSNGEVRLPLDRVESDFSSLFFNFETDGPAEGGRAQQV